VLPDTTGWAEITISRKNGVADVLCFGVPVLAQGVVLPDFVSYRNANSVAARTGLSQQTEAWADALLRSGSQLLFYASNLVVHTLRTINSRSKSKG
jgi:hypothetical protein